MSLDFDAIRAEVIRRYFPQDDLPEAGWVGKRIVPCPIRCHSHKHDDGRTAGLPSFELEANGYWTCKSSQIWGKPGWRSLVLEIPAAGEPAWKEILKAARPSVDLEALWAQGKPEIDWTERFRIAPELSARYLRWCQRVEDGWAQPDPFACTTLALRDATGRLAALKHRIPAGRSWPIPSWWEPEGKHKGKVWRGAKAKYRKILERQGEDGNDLLFLWDRAKDQPQEASLVFCGGEKDALVAASVLDPARWAPVSPCNGEGAIEGLADKVRARRCLIAYDGDAAGHRGAVRLHQVLVEAGAAEVLVAQLPEDAPPGPGSDEGWDVTDVVSALGAEALEQVLVAAGELPAAWGEAKSPCAQADQGDLFDRAGGDQPPGGGSPPSSGPAAGGPPTILLCPRIREMVDQAERALPRDRELYHRHGELVRVVEVEQQPRIRHVVEATLAEVLSSVADFVAETEDGHELRKPPRDVTRALLARGEWPSLRQLAGVVDCPSIRPDGTLLQGEPRYDQASGILYRPTRDWVPVLEQPTKADAERALQLLLDVVADFPFVEASDRSAWVASVLTLVGRRRIQGPVPMFGASAPTPGSGKGKLVAVASLIATGREPEATAAPEHRSEWEKLLTTHAREDKQLILFDNVTGPFGSDALAAALTAETWSGRVLGVSSSCAGKLPIYYATGQNLQFRGDLHRRVVPIAIDPVAENPEEREGWRYPQLEAHVRENRPQLLAAALTILRWHAVEGTPGTGEPLWGSYESWSQVVRDCLLYLGQPDPTAGRERIRAESDPDREIWVELLNAWREGIRHSVTANELVRLASVRSQDEGETARRERLRLALAALDRRLRPENLDPRVLGYRFRAGKGRILDGLRLVGTPQRGGALWRIEDVQGDGVEVPF